MSSDSTFQHTPLTVSEQYIRLIEILPGTSTDPIQCRVREAPLNGADYAALSYQWGSTEEANLKQIKLNSQTFRVTSNLYAFLLSARKRGLTSSFWIDAICIDQTNIPERDEQVKHMGKIYSTSKQVCVWLGENQLESSMTLSELFDASEPATASALSVRARVKIQKWRQEGNDAWLEAVESICSYGYWSRLWIVQEFLLAKAIVIWIGDNAIPAKELSALIVESANQSYVYPPRPFRNRIQSSNIWKLCRTQYGSIKPDSIPDSFAKRGDGGMKSINSREQVIKFLDQPLEDVLINYGMANCFDWHDKIYGLLGLVRNGGTFPVDYSVGKVTLFLSVLGFEPSHNWSMTLALAKLLIMLLEIPDSELLQFKIEDDAGNRQCKTIPMILRGVVDRQSDIKSGQWTLSKPDGKTMTVESCVCERCSLETLPSLLPGDNIYQLELPDQITLSSDILSYLAIRPDGSFVPGYQFVCALTARGDNVDELLLHSLPQVPSKYKFSTLTDDTELLLELDPSMLCFLNRSLTGKIRYVPNLNRFNQTMRKTVYEWNHNLAFHFGEPKVEKGDELFGTARRQMAAEEGSLAQLASLVIGVDRNPVGNAEHPNQQARSGRRDNPFP